jgi:hypothetical protein
MPAGVPSGYNSKGDFFKGITSQMRANEKSSSPGYPGNQTSVAKKLSQLKDQEKSVLQFKPLPSMQVDASDVSAFVQKLDTEKSKVGVNDQHYDNNDVPKMSLVPEKDTNTNNADYTSNVGDELISKERGIQYQEIGHGAGYVEPIKPINAEKDAASAVFMSNYNDDQVFQPNLNEALNNEILNTSDKDLEKASGVAFEKAKKEAENNAVELMAEMKADNDAIEAERARIAQTSATADGPPDLSNFGVNSAYAQGKTEEFKKAEAFKAAKLEAQKNAEELLKEMEQDDELAAYKASQGTINTTKGGLVVVPNDEGIDSGTASDLAVSSTESNMNQLQADLAQAVNEENLYATATTEAQKSLSEEQKADNERLKFKESLESGSVPTSTIAEDVRKRKEEIDKLNANAGTTPLGESQSVRLKDKLKQERFESAKNNSTLGQNFGLKEEADIKLAKENALKEQIRQNKEPVNYSTSDDIAGDTKRDWGKFRKLQAEKKAAKEKADRVADVVDNKTRDDNLIGHKTSKFKHQHAIARGSSDDPYHFTTLAYPPDAVNSQENGHFMLFYVNVQNKTKYEYKGLKNGQVVPVGDMVRRSYFPQGADVSDLPPSQRTGKLVTEYQTGAKEAGLAGPVEYQKQMIQNGGKGNIIYNNQTMLSKGRRSPGQNLNSKYPTTTRITDSVALYLPAGIGNTTSVTYGDYDTGVAGYLAMSGLDVAKGLQEEDFVGVATQLFDKGGTLITDAIKKLALAGMETLGGGSGLQQNFDKIFGQTLNPYIEVAFQSSGMRTFDYTFKFAPKSKAETDEVKAIINLFRFHMLPEMKGTSHRYLTLPSTFDIHYMWQSGITAAKENSFYNKIATCVLTNVDVNYTPNGQVQSFGDGAPTQIDMSLSFKETEMMTKQHVNEGF